LLDYDSTTGAGDVSSIYYTGGKCIGATFDSTGATEIATSSSHFVVTDGGNRIDHVITALDTVPTASIGAFSLSVIELRQ
jgi:hypothetical protein